MLRFATKPDRIFVILLGQAIEETIGYLELDDDATDQQDSLVNMMPRSAKLFDARTVMTQLANLKTAFDQASLYQPTDYHWLLLYETLDAYCTVFNELPHGPLAEEYGIERLDFDALIDLFFWDTDFLDAHLPLIPLEARQQLDISPETFGLTAGMKPHPDELRLKLCDAELVKTFDGEQCVTFLPGSKDYPSLPDVHAN